MMESLEHIGASPGADPQSAKAAVAGSVDHRRPEVWRYHQTGPIVPTSRIPSGFLRPSHGTASGGPTDPARFVELAGSVELADQGSTLDRLIADRLVAGARAFGAI